MKIYISDDEFKNALKLPIYNEVKLQTIRLLLVYIERNGIKKHKNTYFDEKTRPDNLDDDQWTIEHIFPQDKNMKNGWREMLSNLSDEEIYEKRDDYIHKLGNLTLIGYNSELSNKSFKDKKEYISDSGVQLGLTPELYLNQSIYDGQSIDKKIYGISMILIDVQIL